MTVKNASHQVGRIIGKELLELVDRYQPLLPPDQRVAFTNDLRNFALSVTSKVQERAGRMIDEYFATKHTTEYKGHYND